LWGLQDEVSHHFRRYTAPDLRRKVKSAGLEIDKLTYANMFLFPFIWAGRQALKLVNNNIQGTSENDLHPSWSNQILRRIFLAEKPLLRQIDLPLGVSVFCIARKASL